MVQEQTSGDLLVGQVIEKCKILSRIARGGMGVVYLAQHTGLQRRVAIKILPPDVARNREFVARFRREGIAAAKLVHPNIVQVYDVGDHEGLPFLVMQYVEGFTVAELAARSKLEPKEAARVARDVARGLRAAHAEGIVHRDIKPENILISESGEVKITDFGVASDADQESHVANAQVVGTPHYLSPEQAQGGKADARSDLYSLGATLYAMVTGRTPFSADNVMTVLYKHIHEAPKKPSLYARNLPYALEAVILKLMSKNPEERYASAEQVEGELDRFIRGVLIKPRPKSEPLRALPPSASRKPTVATFVAIGAAAAALAVGLVFLFGGEGKTEPGLPPPRASAERPPAVPKPFDSAQGKPFDPAQGKPAPALPPAPAAEVGYAPLYRSKADASFWAHTPGLERSAFFLDDGILVSFPTANTEPDQVEFLLLRRADFEEFVFRFEVRAEALMPAVAVGLVLSDLAIPARRGRWTGVALDSLSLKAWHEVEVELKDRKFRAASGGRVLVSGELAAGASPFGSIGLACRPGTDFQVRKPRILPGRRNDLTRLATLPAPAAARPAPPAADPGRARAVRDEVLSRPRRDLLRGGSLDGWETNEAGRGIPRARDGAVELLAPGKSVSLFNDSLAEAEGLSFELRVRRFHSTRGAGLVFNRRDAQRYHMLVFFPGAVVLSERQPGGWQPLARRVHEASPGRGHKVELVSSAGRAYVFVDGELLWEGAAAGAGGLGRGTGFVADDVDCEFAAVAAYPAAVRK